MVINLFKKLRSEFLLMLILVVSAFVRLFQIGPLLGFWYDPGRDAIVIWDLLHYGRFFLIGPVTGIDGIYLGPFYYYLLTPFYWLGKGNPVFASAGLTILGALTVYLVYSLGTKIYNRKTGLIAVLIYGFSYEVILTNRWLSNPNPLPFFTMLVWLFLYRFIKGNQISLIIASFLVGLCLQLEAASATFFIPAILLIVFLERRKISKLYVPVLSIFAFFVTLIPQLLFNFRHDGVLVGAFKRFLITEKSFSLSIGQLLSSRLNTYYDVLFQNLFPNTKIIGFIVLALFSATVLIFRKKLFSKERKYLLIWVLTPLIGYIFYRGNHGYLWGYYLVGILPIYIIIFAAGLESLSAKWLFGKITVGLFLIAFIIINTRNLKNFYITGIGITLRAQLKAIDWVYQDAGSESFNYDVYVPPQIYFPYSYLFRWYGKTKYGHEPETKLVDKLYTLAEPDGEHPQFLKAWQERQDKIGIIEKEYFWGDITTQRRKRILYE